MLWCIWWIFLTRNRFRYADRLSPEAESLAAPWTASPVPSLRSTRSHLQFLWWRYSQKQRQDFGCSQCASLAFCLPETKSKSANCWIRHTDKALWFMIWTFPQLLSPTPFVKSHSWLCIFCVLGFKLWHIYLNNYNCMVIKSKQLFPTRKLLPSLF